MSNIIPNNKRIALNTLFLYLRQIIVLLLTLYLSRLVLDVLGVEDFGIYNVVGGFVYMFAFMNTSMANGVQRFLNIDIGETGGNNIKKIHSISVCIQILLACIFLLLAETIGLWYINNVMVVPDDRLFAANWVFQCSILSFIFVILQVPYTAAVMAYEKMNYFAFVNVTDVVLRFISVYIMTFIRDVDNLILYSCIIMLVSAISFSLYYVYSKKKFKTLIFEKKNDKNLFRQMISFSGWNIFGSFAYMIKDQGLNMLLNLYFGPIVNAARAVSYQVSSALNGFSGNVFTAFRPQLMQSYSSKNYNRTTLLMFTMSKFTYFLMVLIAFPIIIEIDFILSIWLGNNVPNQTSIFTVLVILNMLVTNFNPPVSQVVHATGNMRRYQIITSIVLTSILPISWLFLHLGFSAISVFIITLIISIINQFICLIVLKKIYEYSISLYLLNVLFPCFIVSVVVLPLTYLVHIFLEIGVIRLLTVFGINFLVSIVAIFYIGLTETEKNVILTKVKSILKKVV